MIKIRHRGDFKNTERFFNKNKKINIVSILEKYGQAGVAAVSDDTQVVTRLTAKSWE